jgi:hypothetical protein
MNNNLKLFLSKINRNRILSILHIGKDYLNLYLREIFLTNTLKNVLEMKLSDAKFLYLTQSNLYDELKANNILNATLSTVNDDIVNNEDLLLIYNKEDVELEFTLDSKN